MKLFLFAIAIALSTPAFAQQYWPTGPVLHTSVPDAVRVEHLTDEEYRDLKRLEADRQTALDTYVKARDAYHQKLDNLQSHYNAVPSESCDGVTRKVEWKGSYIVVDEYSKNAWGCGNNMLVGPATINWGVSSQ